ncbi:hypothetical protein WDJ51_02665 [Rathayibacter sp. YIM 133350]|uniref:hypothetical protein n=1 Tax=Rathayibacter sp. YIM 133350 TaxID=3131992 RepID=UPI00307D5B1C
MDTQNTPTAPSPAPDAEARIAETSADDGLLPRLRVIEDQPLADRAAAYAALHDSLRDALDGTAETRSQA